LFENRGFQATKKPASGNYFPKPVFDDVFNLTVAIPINKRHTVYQYN